MRLTDWRRQPWRADLALLLTLCLLFLPAWVGLQGGSGSASATAQAPAVTPRPILVVPLQAAEGVPTGVAEGVTFALVEELEASRQFSPTRLSLDEPTIQRLIQEGQLAEDTVANVLQQPTPEGIAQIASAMKIADAVYGTVDSYAYDPKANGGVVKVKVTARFLKIDLTTGAVTETKEISKEGSSAPKLAPRPEKELAVEAFRNAVRQILSEFLGLPAPPPPPPPPKAISALPILVGLLLLGALIGAGRGKGAPAPAVAPGPANAPSRVTAFPQGSAIVVTWQPPAQGSPIGYNVYRADAGSASRQADIFQRLNATPIPNTQYIDNTAQSGRLYLYAVSAVYPNNAESERVPANVELTGQPVPVGIGVPLPPRNLQAQPGDGSVRLTWEDPNPSGFVKGYRIYRQAGAPPTDANLIADETTVRTTTFIDRGLSNGTPYFYVVRAVSTQGYLSAPSVVVSATPGNLPPQAPTLSGQFNPATFTVTLSWTPPPDPDIAYYEVARVVESIQRSRALTTRVTRQTPIINLPPGVARRVLQTNPRLRQVSSPFDNNIIATNVTVTSFQDLVAQFRPSGQAPTTYYVLRYAVRAVDQSGNKGAWSNAIEITPNSPPPSLSALRPRLIPSNGQVLIDLKPLLDAAAGDAEWQVDRRGVRIFRSTTKGGTQAPALTPIHSVDPLPLEQLDQGRYFRDTQVSNGTRYFYAVELVDKLGIAGGRSQEAVATPFASASITIAAQNNRTELSGNGQDKVQLIVSVVDANNRPIAGFPLLVSLTGQGTLTVDPAYQDPQVPGGAITDENGQAIAVYQAPTVTADTTATITAAPGASVTGVAPVSLTLTVRVPRVASIDVRPQKTQLTADGLDVTDVIITVRDSLGQPVPNKTVNLTVTPSDPTNFGRFENLSGNPVSQTTTGTDGTARVRYRAGRRTGSVTLQASVTEGATTISGQAVVTLVPGAPATIELVANPSSAPADGSTEVRVTATVRDAQGNAVPRVQVQFSAAPSLTITPSVATTDDTGQATVSITAPTQAGVYTLQARVGSVARTIALTFTAGSAATLTLSASRTDLLVSLPPTYGATDYSNLLPLSTTEIRATVVDSNGNRIPNVVVQFDASAGTIQRTAVTDNSGVASVTYIAPVGPPGTVIINASAGTAQQSLSLNILPGPAARVRVTASPLVLPMNGRSQSQVDAYVFDANGNAVSDGTIVTFQLNPSIGRLLQNDVPTTGGKATTFYIAPATADVAEVTVNAVARSVVSGTSFQTDPNDPFSQPRVAITLGAQIQIDRISFSPEIAVSSSDGTTNPADRQSLRSRAPTNNSTNLTIKLVNGQGQAIPRSGVQVIVRATDSNNTLVPVLFVDLTTGNRSLGLLPASTDNAGQVRLQMYASSAAIPVTVTAELRDSQGNVFSSDAVTITQRPGDPYQIILPLPQPNILFVPGAGTPTSTTITARVRDKVNNPVEAGIPVTFEAKIGSESVGVFTPSTTVTDAQGEATTTLTSSLHTGVVSVTAQTTPAVPQPGSTQVAFVTGVSQINVTAASPQIGGDNDPNDNIPDSTTITATFVGTIPDGTKVTFTTTRGTFNPQSPVPVRSQSVAVANNAAQVTLFKESVTRDTPAVVSVTVLKADGQPVTGSVTVTIRPIPQPPVLQDLQVAQTTLVVSDTNSLNPSLRNPLDPNLPNATIVTVSVREQNTNQPVQGASVLLSSSDPDTLWVVGSNARLRETTVLTDAQGQAQATFYTSKKAGTVTITAQLDNQTKTAQITQVPGPALITLSANPTEIFVRLPDNFTTADGQNHDYRNLARKAQITATIADANGNPYENVTVTFTATAGLISSPAVTGSDGKATVDFAALQVPAGGQTTVSAQATINSQNLNASVNVRVRPGPPAKVSVAATPLSLPADGRSTATITVSVTDANDNPVKDGTLVTLRLENPPPGTVLLPSGTTSMNLFTSGGQATATLLAGTTPGGATISATSSETISNTTFSAANSPKLTLPIGITLQPLQVSASQVFVSKSDYTSFGNQYPNTATVTVQVAGGQNLSGVQINLTASDPNVAWNTPQTKGSIIVTTGSDGRAQVTYLASPRAGDVVITATLGNQTQTATIRQLPGPPTVQLMANPSDIFVSLQGSQYASLPQQSQITVTVTDENGNPHPNASVQLSTTAGTFAQSSGPTDAQGKFTTTLTAPNQVPLGGRATVTARVTTTRGERIDAQPIDITIRPGPPAIVELRSTKLTLSTSDTATIIATVKDANGNPVPSISGRTVPVTFSLQVSPANNGKVTLSPITGNTDPSGQVTTSLTTSNANPDTAVITAEAVETLQGTFFRASSSLSVSVGVTPILLSPPEILDASTLVVSNNNDPNPNNRQALDPALPNRTGVRIRVANTGGQPLPVTFISNDNNTLWQDLNNPALTGLGSLTTTLNPQGEATVRFYASSRKGSVQIKVRMNGQETPSAVIQQVAGLPAFITLTSDKAVVPQGDAATITATITDNAAPQPNRVRQGTRVSFRLISAPQGVSLETPTDRTTPDENGQVSIRLLVANNAANGVATVEARTDNGITQTLSLPVGVSPTLQPLSVTNTNLSVSADNNVPNRTAVNGATLPNQTTVKVSAQNTAGLPIQVTLSSNDPNTLWVDGVNARLQQITVTLDANGEKTVTFVASATARQVTITASLNGQTQTAIITQQPGPPAQITLSTDRDVIPNGGTAQLTARVVDAANPPNPVPNATVNFSLIAAPANTTLNPTTGNTSPSGEVSTTLQAPATGSGQATVRAQVTSSLNPPPAQVTLFVGLNPSLQSLSVLTSILSVAQNDTTTNPADRVNLGPEPSNTQITVQATNTGGQPIPVEFIASDSKVLWDDGTNRALGTLRTNLDANGRATVTYYASSKAGNVQVTVRLNTPNPQTLATVITQLPGNPDAVQLSADKQIVPPADQATITAVVKDAANNPVRDGTQVTFQLQPGAPAGTSLLPPTTVPTLNGQAQVRLLAGTLSGQATVQAQSGAANANITLFVGVAPTIAPVQVANPNLVVSDSNSADPAQRRPLDPNAQNNTVVTVQVRGLGGQPVPIILRSSDDNTLWVNRRDTSQRALREITITTDANGVVEALFYTSTRAQTVTITAVVGNETAQTTIVQKAGPPAQINLALQGFSAAPDGTPYLNIQQQGTIVATVVDANGNPVPNASVNFALSPNLNGDEGNLNPANAITGADGKVQTTLTASAFSTQVTLRAQTGSVTATRAIRYSVSVPGLTIVANPNQIPDDNTTTSVISITSSDANRPLPNGFKFRLSADLGATLTAEAADQPNLLVTVGNGQPAGEGANEARATLKGPSPDLSQTQPRTITVTADLIVDGQPRSFTQTVTLLPRIQVVANFGLSNNPNQLVVSSTNDTDPSRRVPLDTVAGHNKAVLRIRLNGSAAPNPSFVTVSATDPNVLLRALDLDANGNPTNTELGRQLGTLSVNFKPLGNPVTNWDAYVEVYSSTLAGPVTLQLNLLGVTRTITYTQIPGLPAIVTVAPDRSVIGVQGMTTLPTSTTVRALIRDAAGNLVTTPGVTVTFNAEAGTLNPTSTQASNGVATTTLTSNNETRRVRVFATAVQGNAQATGVATMVFAVSVSSISLTTDKPKDQQGRVLLDPNDNVRVIANLSPTGGTPDGTRLQVELTGAYGLIQSVTPVQSNTANALILNNNTTNVDQTAIVRFIAFNEQGLPVSSPDQIIVMKGVTATPIIQLTAAATELKVSTSNSTNENNRNALNPGGPSTPTGATANRTTLTVTLNITGLSANEPVTLTLSSTDLNGLFTNDEAQNDETGQLGSLTVLLNADGGGNLNTVVQRAYWASTKAGNFVITAEVKRQTGQVIGRAQLNIVQRPGNPSQIFVTTDPPRLAVSTVTGEPTTARVLATILDANNNPVPNWWVFFQLQPVPVNMNPDTTDNGGRGESQNIPGVSDGGLNPFAARSDAGGVASSLLQSINTSQPVRIIAIVDANNDGQLQGADQPQNSVDTVYYVPLLSYSAVVDYTSQTKNIIVTVNPASALPRNTAIWVCRYAPGWNDAGVGDDYAVDNDGDGRFDEDRPGDTNGDNNPDDDGDGRVDEDNYETLRPTYYRVIVTEDGRLVVPAFPLGNQEIGIVNVRIFIYTKDGTMLRIRIDQVQNP